ncbi:MAG: alpha-mannosidase [Snowella sp.]|nr:alpha-mannosidase [Snowella sp.]
MLELIQKLRHLTQRDIQAQWYRTAQKVLTEEFQADQWEIAPLNENQYIIWAKGRQIQWLTQQIIIPHDLAGYPLAGLSLRLALTWWAEDAKIYVNGELVQEGDLFDSMARILLTPSVQTGEKITVTLRLVSPAHDIGGLMRSRLLYERNYPELDPGFIADEFEVLHKYLEAFEPEQLPILENALHTIPWDKVNDAEAFDQALLELREQLTPLARNITDRQFHLLGHAHLDMAWLWPLAETWEVGERTFRSVLTLQQEFPDLKFGHTSPVLYEWIEKHRPELFSQIQQAVKAGRWELLGGMWVEPEVNLISGESFVRQFLYGQRYFQEKFGKISKVAWLPDSFGFTWQLPQFCKLAGIEYFVTGKLHWNDSTKFPYGAFWWRSPDGTQLLTAMSPPNVAGVMDINPITMVNYAVEWEKQTDFQDSFWLPGVGDHGGGPSRDMWQVKQRWQASEFFPNIYTTTAFSYLSNLKYQQFSENKKIPVWQDELYLEFHRGCYTTHADQKLQNRRCENLLYEAELWSSIAHLVTGLTYPKAELEQAWKLVLLNQFHDILPGTSIPQVFTDANQAWQQVRLMIKPILENALQAIASQINLSQPLSKQAKPIVVFNSLNWQRSEVVTYPIEDKNFQIYDISGNLIPSQITNDQKLCFLAENIPAFGYQVFWLFSTNNQSFSKSINHAEDFILENQFIKVMINSETGEIDSIFDKISQREILSDAGNQLQFFEDKGQYWDAWNIDPNYADHPLPTATLKSIQIIEYGPILQKIRVIKQFNQSEFCQDYCLENHSPILNIITQVDWQESQVLVKAAFPLALESDVIHYEIPCAAIARSTRPETPAEKAKWEVPALQWADLTDTEQNYGISLLNNCKYGYDGQPNQLRLTLLRSPKWPDPQADKGIHQFTYAIYPHSDTWQTAKTVQRAHELNCPLHVMSVGPSTANLLPKTLPSTHQFLDLNAENVCLMAFKQAETDPSCWILRFYECEGKTANLQITNHLNLAIADTVNLLEESIDPATAIAPWKIVSLAWRLTN